MTDPTGPAPTVSTRQIADLLAWARALAEQPFDIDPRERAAFQQAKIDLLGRISDPDPHRTTEGGGV